MYSVNLHTWKPEQVSSGGEQNRIKTEKDSANWISTLDIPTPYFFPQNHFARTPMPHEQSALILYNPRQKLGII